MLFDVVMPVRARAIWINYIKKLNLLVMELSWANKKLETHENKVYKYRKYKSKIIGTKIIKLALV